MRKGLEISAADQAKLLETGRLGDPSPNVALRWNYALLLQAALLVLLFGLLSVALYRGSLFALVGLILLFVFSVGFIVFTDNEARDLQARLRRAEHEVWEFWAALHKAQAERVEDIGQMLKMRFPGWEQRVRNLTPADLEAFAGPEPPTKPDGNGPTYH